MTYQVVGFKNGQITLITLKDEVVKKSEWLHPIQDGPEGGIAKMPTPEADRISKERAVDHSLDGVINKNKEKNEDKTD